jgi:hypothetical protein
VNLGYIAGKPGGGGFYRKMDRRAVKSGVVFGAPSLGLLPEAHVNIYNFDCFVF